VVVDAGGPAAFINARPTSDRRFLVEQMAVLELIGWSTTFIRMGLRMLSADLSRVLDYMGQSEIV
jgi:hypothetical protein